MIYQIAGAAIIVTSIICGTWYAVTVRRENEKNRVREQRERKARNERIMHSELLKMYEDECQRRLAAETRMGVYEHQLKRAREQMAKVIIGK